jgi:hypothetical protein
MSDQAGLDIEGEKPVTKLKATPARKARPGIGDNSGNNPHAETAEPESVSSRNISDQTTTTQAQVFQFDALYGSHNAALQKPSREMVSTFFAFVYLLHNTGQDAAFRQKHKIAAHGNSRNRCRPLLAFFFRQIHKPYVKSTLSKWGAIIARGIALGQSPDEFTEALNSTGIENLYEQCKLTVKKEGSSDLELAQSILLDRPEAPVFSDEIVANELGDRVAVIRCDGAGVFRLVSVVISDDGEVTKFLAGLARKQRAQNE